MPALRRTVLGLLVLALCTVGTAGYEFWHHGYRAYIIHTGSMTGAYDSGDLVLDTPVSMGLHKGETITFVHSGGRDLVTHRIISVSSAGIRTKGDANPTPDAWRIRPDQVKGVVATSIPDAGYVVYFFKQPAGDAAAMTAVVALMLLWGLFFGDQAGVDVKGRSRRADGNGDKAAGHLDPSGLPTFAQAIEQLRRRQSLLPPADADATAVSL